MNASVIIIIENCKLEYLFFRCMVKITGNVMMSFPAGVVRVFTENPSPALLSFKIKNTSRLEQVLLNQQLIIQ